MNDDAWSRGFDAYMRGEGFAARNLQPPGTRADWDRGFRSAETYCAQIRAGLARKADGYTGMTRRALKNFLASGALPAPSPHPQQRKDSP